MVSLGLRTFFVRGAASGSKQSSVAVLSCGFSRMKPAPPGIYPLCDVSKMVSLGLRTFFVRGAASGSKQSSVAVLSCGFSRMKPAPPGIYPLCDVSKMVSLGLRTFFVRGMAEARSGPKSRKRRTLLFEFGRTASIQLPHSSIIAIADWRGEFWFRSSMECAG